MVEVPGPLHDKQSSSMVGAQLTELTTESQTTDPPRDWKTHLNHNAPRPFAQVSQNLLSIGSLSVDRFLSAPLVGPDSLDIPYHVQDLPPPPSSPLRPSSPLPDPQQSPEQTNTPTPVNPAVRMQTVAQLHQTCQRVFGSTDALKFEFIEDDGATSKQCVLTITRPNGSTRSYKTQPIYARKNEAKAQAASIAIEMGAVDFILTGDSDILKAKKGILLAPLDAPDISETNTVVDVPVEPPPPEDDPLVKEIDRCCEEWRGGRVKPHWVALNDPKFGNKYGAALRIQLSPHSFRVYSSNTTFDDLLEAKKACAQDAHDQGVMDYIKYGNGQNQPAAFDPPTEAPEDQTEEPADPPITTLALQTFYETLPQPFPEPFGDKTASEINAPGWLNTTIQASRGGRLAAHFIWITDGTLGLHGCLLRVDRPGECRSYLVDPRFPKRADAKAAVCLLAMSQGIGGYIRAIGSVIESKVTPEMRKFATEQIFPTLSSECRRIRPGGHPIFEFDKDRDAFGCTLKLEVSAINDDTREYTVIPEYRTKADAKVAVACTAVQQGVIELLRFHGEPPPPDYVPFVMHQSGGFVPDQSNKRKEIERDDAEGQDRKKRKKGNKGIKIEQGDISSLQTNEAMAGRARHSLPSRPPDAATSNHDRNGNNRGSWKKPHASGSSGHGATGRPARAGQPVGQFRHGPRNVGNSTLPYGGGPQVNYFGNQMPGPPVTGHHPYAQVPDGRLGYGGGQTVPYQFGPHPPPEPFPGSAYPPHLNPGMPSHYASGPTIYQTPQYVGPHPPPVPPPSYLQPYGIAPPQVQYGPYASSQYHQQYPPPVDLVNYPPHSQAVYASGPAPVVSGHSPHHHPSNYPPNYGRSHPHFTQPLSPQYPHTSQSERGSHASHNSHPVNNRHFIKEESPWEGDLGRYEEHEENHLVNTHPEVSRNRRQSKHGKGRELSNGFSTTELPLEEQIHLPSVPSRENTPKGTRPGLKKQHPRPVAPDIVQETNHNSKAGTAISKTPKSHMKALFDHCRQENIPQPQFLHEIVNKDTGGNHHKVWVILGTERLELPVTFPSLGEGQERVAKQVLNRLRSRSKKRNDKDKS